MLLHDPSTWVKPARICCEMCETEFMGVEDYIDHKSKRHPSMPRGMEYLYCTPCQLVFCGMRSMRSHMTEAHLPQCQECGRGSEHGAALAHHKRPDHDINYNPRVVLVNCGVKNGDTSGDKANTSRHANESDTSSDLESLVEDVAVAVPDVSGTKANVRQPQDEALAAGARVEMAGSTLENGVPQSNPSHPSGPGYVYMGGRWWWRD